MRTSLTKFLTECCRILRFFFFKAASDQKKLEKGMMAEKNKWMSDSRKAVIADEAVMLKEYERVQLDEARIKSEQLRAVCFSIMPVVNSAIWHRRSRSREPAVSGDLGI
jgi:hypothetical protein